MEPGSLEGSGASIQVNSICTRSSELENWKKRKIQDHIEQQMSYTKILCTLLWNTVNLEIIAMFLLLRKMRLAENEALLILRNVGYEHQNKTPF